MSIKDHAYLAPEMAGWLIVNRKRNHEWFDLAFEINRRDDASSPEAAASA